MSLTAIVEKFVPVEIICSLSVVLKLCWNIFVIDD